MLVDLRGLLQRRGWKVAAVHGGIFEADRNKAVVSFQKGSSSVLVATDVAARGLDIPNVDYIINYSFPYTFVCLNVPECTDITNFAFKLPYLARSEVVECEELTSNQDTRAVVYPGNNHPNNFCRIVCACKHKLLDGTSGQCDA